MVSFYTFFAKLYRSRPFFLIVAFCNGIKSKGRSLKSIKRKTTGSGHPGQGLDPGFLKCSWCISVPNRSIRLFNYHPEIYKFALKIYTGFGSDSRSGSKFRVKIRKFFP
jgi:hypothetical protein